MELSGIKTENDEVLCHGCLSAERKFSPLTNFELYFILLGNKHTQEEYKYLNILLCWECHALLQRTEIFRQRLQDAQYTLSLVRDQQIAIDSLSTLKFSHKRGYDCTVEEFTDDDDADKQDLIPFVDESTDIDVKTELGAEHCENDNLELNSSNNDNHEEIAIKTKKKKQYKKHKENSLDTDNYENDNYELNFSDSDNHKAIESKTNKKNQLGAEHCENDNLELNSSNNDNHEEITSKPKKKKQYKKHRENSDSDNYENDSYELNFSDSDNHKAIERKPKNKKQYTKHKEKSLDTDNYKNENSELNFNDNEIERKKKKKLNSDREESQLQDINSTNPDNSEDDNLELNSENEKEIKPKKKKRYKKDREKSHLQKIDNKLDLSDPDKYFTEVCLSEKEVEEILAREREEDICKPHKCDKCGFQFTGKMELYKHTRIMHRQRAKKPKCPHCSVAHKTLWDLELHCWRAHASARCSMCAAVVAMAPERRRHLLLHKRRYRCRECGVDFINKHLFAYHEVQLHSNYVCDHCGHVYAIKKSLENHVIRHHLPSKCFECDILFINWDRLRRHLCDVHKSGGPAYCVECDIKYPTQAKYRRHLSQSAKHRPKKKISVPCPECGKTFSRRTYMNSHRKLFHSNESRHHCRICNKYFVNGFTLRSHNKYVHEKIQMPKTKICSVCGRAFATTRVLVHHMRTHTGERPHACAHCSAAFAQRVALKAHLAAIHKEK